MKLHIANRKLQIEHLPRTLAGHGGLRRTLHPGPGSLKQLENPIARSVGPSFGTLNGIPECGLECSVQCRFGGNASATRHNGKERVKHLSHSCELPGGSLMSCSLQGMRETYLNIGSFSPFLDPRELLTASAMQRDFFP